MKVMVFDVGGTEIKYSVMDDTMNYYESGSVPTPSDSQEHFLETMAEIYHPHRDEVDGIALSLPGFIDAEHGVVKGGGAPSIVYNIGTPVGPRLAEKCGSRTTARPPPSPNCSGVSSRAAATRRCSSLAPAWAAASSSMASWCGAGTLRRGSTAS